MNRIMLLTTSKLLTVFCLLLGSAFAMADTGDSVCYPIFEKGGAVPKTSACATAAGSVNVGTNPQCKTDGSFANRYCGDSCYANVVALDNLPRPSGAPQNGFTDTQTCIAKSSCLGKSSLASSHWLDEVVTTFVTPFTSRTGDWKKVMGDCDNYSSVSYINQKYCEQHMAQYHIKNDLQNALNTDGCGDPGDWDQIGKNISQCVQEANSVPVAGILAAAIVKRLRNSVRTQCVAYRQAHNLPVQEQLSPLVVGQPYFCAGNPTSNPAICGSDLLAAAQAYAQRESTATWTFTLSSCNPRACMFDWDTSGYAQPQQLYWAWSSYLHWSGPPCSSGLWADGACLAYRGK